MKLSVFSCWHNRLHDLELSVRSVLDQQGVEFEYIIVDDASTDGSQERLLAIADPRLRVLRNAQNVGFTRSCIRAVEASRGEYVAFHDAGDLSLPGRLAKQVALLDADPDVVAVGCLVENHTLATGDRRPWDPRGGEELGLEMRFTHGEVMFRRAAYDAVGGYRPVFYHTQDKDLWFRMRAVGRLDMVPETLYERRIFADGIQGDMVRQIRQGIFSNLMLHCAMERLAGRPDPVEKQGALALLTQPPNHRFTRRARILIPAMLRGRLFSDARRALDVAPAGMLSWWMLATLILLRLFTRRP